MQEDAAPEDAAPEDVSGRYRRLAAAMTEKIEQVPADAWENLSPCVGWTALDVVRHLVEVHGRFQGLVGRSLVEHSSVDQDAVSAFVAVRDQMQADLEDPARVAEEYDGRLGRSTFGKAVDGFVCFDLVIHNWDLSRAAGLDDSLDPRDVARVQAMVDAMGQVMRENGVIGSPIDPPDGASAQDRLLCELGREV